MEKYLAALLIFVSTPIIAEPFETKQTVICEETEIMFNKLKKQYGEKIILYADQTSTEEPDVYVTVWIGDNGTFSVVETHMKYKVSCLISAGLNAKYKIEELL